MHGEDELARRELPSSRIGNRKLSRELGREQGKELDRECRAESWEDSQEKSQEKSQSESWARAKKSARVVFNSIMFSLIMFNH